MAVIGIDVGGTKIAAGRLGTDLGVERSVVIPTPHGGIKIVDAIAALCADLGSDSTAPITAIGVGLPATIDAVTGRVAHSVHTGMVDFDAAGPLETRTGLPVVLDNDANLALLAEHRMGAAEGSQTALLLTLGTGVGGGIVIGGQIFRGGRGHGAELGHICVDGDGGGFLVVGAGEDGGQGFEARGKAVVRRARHPVARQGVRRPDAGEPQGVAVVGAQRVGQFKHGERRGDAPPAALRVVRLARGANGALVLLGAIKSDGAQNLSGRRFKAVDRLSFSEHRGGLHIAGEEARVARDAESLEVVSCHGTGRIRA